MASKPDTPAAAEPPRRRRRERREPADMEKVAPEDRPKGARYPRSKTETWADCRLDDEGHNEGAEQFRAGARYPRNMRDSWGDVKREARRRREGSE